jgi:hypothetical protein
MSLALPSIRVLGSSQVSVEVFRTPVLDDDRKDGQNRYGEQVVVKHGIPVRKPCGFYSFTHCENLGENGVRGGKAVRTSRDHICSGGSAVDHHPEVADVQVPHNAGDLREVDQHRTCTVEITGCRSIRRCSDDRRQDLSVWVSALYRQRRGTRTHHEAEGNKSQACYTATEPNHFPVRLRETQI